MSYFGVELNAINFFFVFSIIVKDEFFVEAIFLNPGEVCKLNLGGSSRLRFFFYKKFFVNLDDKFLFNIALPNSLLLKKI